jgi:hypothetical protein
VLCQVSGSLLEKSPNISPTLQRKSLIFSTIMSTIPIPPISTQSSSQYQNSTNSNSLNGASIVNNNNHSNSSVSNILETSNSFQLLPNSPSRPGSGGTANNSHVHGNKSVGVGSIIPASLDFQLESAFKDSPELRANFNQVYLLVHSYLTILLLIPVSRCTHYYRQLKALV